MAGQRAILRRVAVTGGGLVVNGEPAGCTRAAVTTAGVAREACRDHNLPVLAGHQHAVPIALFAGSSGSLDAIDLGAAPDTCLMFTAPKSTARTPPYSARRMGRKFAR